MKYELLLHPPATRPSACPNFFPSLSLHLPLIRTTFRHDRTAARLGGAKPMALTWHLNAPSSSRGFITSSRHRHCSLRYYGSRLATPIAYTVIARWNLRYSSSPFFPSSKRDRSGATLSSILLRDFAPLLASIDYLIRVDLPRRSEVSSRPTRVKFCARNGKPLTPTCDVLCTRIIARAQLDASGTTCREKAPAGEGGAHDSHCEKYSPCHYTPGFYDAEYYVRDMLD